MATGIVAYLDALDPASRALIDRLRALALAAAPGVTEHIKWNAPSFCINGDDRITLGLDTRGGVRAVLHRGAKVKDSSGFRFNDPHGTARWPAVDRGVVTLPDMPALDAAEPAITDLFARWLEATK